VGDNTDSLRIIELLQLFKNVVLEGVPGTGKTYAAEEVVEHWQSSTGRDLGARTTITLHPSTAYEDTIEGLRPTLSGIKPSFVDDVPEPEEESTPFGLQNGLFIEACRQAADDPDRDYLLILDELNRANVPKVLGDLLLVLEASKRAVWDGSSWGEGTTTHLAYSQREFWVPDNLYVLATMNTSDRSVAPLDAALRRRFAFARLEPLPSALLDEMVEDKFGADPAGELASSIEIWGRLNDELLRPCLGPDGQLGHSYFYDLARALLGLPNVDRSGWEALYDELGSGQTSDGLTIEAAMWHETRTMTGEADNQLDLTKGGVANPHRGSVHFFVDNPMDSTSVRVRYNGDWFDGSELKYYAGGNGTWRLNMKGESASGTLTEHAKNGDFLDTVLVFLRTPDGYELRRFPKEVMDGFAAASDDDVSRTAPAKARRYGFFHVRAVAAGDAIATHWQYAILPQLLEIAVSNGAEDLLNPERRATWFDSRPEVQQHQEQAIDALEALDTFLASLGLRITVSGSGLGRGPSVDRSVVAQ
jgi:hypothetical protein